MRMLIIIPALALAGCASPGLMTPEQLQALASDKSTVVLCSEVRTLTTTVRTVYLQSDKGAAGTVAAGAECALALSK
jgi:hypothetical protein